ncbi:MAG: sodium:solute symporter [Cyclobacteriaceae bacterium]|nr:sodium:solute symporter [Cyclobacteriaceae bacterium]MDW8331742.1 sodium:solute symporter [Cyclobacteriaceae bacterium]
MNALDWLVLFFTLAAIVIYGVIKTRGSRSMEVYLRGDGTLKWWMIGISIMATQASAITFLSTPGQAIEDGMRFIQFYFGLPLAMIIISAFFVPVYYKLNVLTAYEYLEQRFDLKTRALTAFLFLLLRGLSAGITIFAPSLILSTVLHWPVEAATLLIGTLVMIYSVSGGSRAVSLTQRLQLTIVMCGMLLAGVIAYSLLPDQLDFIDTVRVAGHLGKLNMINFLPADADQHLPAGVASVDQLTWLQKVDLVMEDRFNIWSGLIASVFLFLSYFGTDQSQVGRYLGGKNLTESRLGLIFNGLLKIPMQFIILFIGVLVFVFYLFHQPPVYHNQVLYQRALKTASEERLLKIEKRYDSLYSLKQNAVNRLAYAIEENDEKLISASRTEVRRYEALEKRLRQEVRDEIQRAFPKAKVQDRDYIFLNFVLNHLPHGIIGLLLAVMFLAAMSSVAGELSALTSATTVDIYRRLLVKDASARNYLLASKGFSVLWTGLAVTFAIFASFAENLIQFVNIIGSLFYGTILGVFITAFFIRYVKGTAVFFAAICAELLVLFCYTYTNIAFLLYNMIGCAGVVLFGLLFQWLINLRQKAGRSRPL